MNTNPIKTMYTFSPVELAIQFSKQLREMLTVDQMQMVLDRNATSGQEVCATHDFCDANQLMCDSFEDLANREVYLPGDVEESFCTPEQVDADQAITDAAWRLAREAGFDPEEIAHRDLENQDEAILREAVDASLDAGCAVIQRYLGVTTGDFAGVYFSGSQDALTERLRAYLDAQRADVERD